MRVLFVCLGNICRSPMAEGLLRKYAQEQGVKIEVDSAATSRYQIGEAPHPGTQKILKQHQVDVQNMIARQITSEDFLTFDYIIGMDRQNVIDLMKIAPDGTKKKVHLFLSVEEVDSIQDVPDPWYTGDFQKTNQLIQAALPKWLTYWSENESR